MIIADLLQISINLIFVAQIIVCLLLLGIVLMQRPKQEGLGAAFGAALTDQAFGARTTDVLQKGTVYLGSLFMILSFVLSLLIIHRYDKNKSSLDQTPAAEIQTTEGNGTGNIISEEDLLKQLQAIEDASGQKQAETPAIPEATEESIAPAEETTADGQTPSE